MKNMSRDNMISKHSRGKNRGTVSVLHVRIGNKLREIIEERSKEIGLSVSAYVRMVLSERTGGVKREVKA